MLGPNKASAALAMSRSEPVDDFDVSAAMLGVASSAVEASKTSGKRS